MQGYDMQTANVNPKSVVNVQFKMYTVSFHEGNITKCIDSVPPQCCSTKPLYYISYRAHILAPVDMFIWCIYLFILPTWPTHTHPQNTKNELKSGGGELENVAPVGNFQNDLQPWYCQLQEETYMHSVNVNLAPPNHRHVSKGFWPVYLLYISKGSRTQT